MRAHLGLVVFVVLMAAGVALEIVGQNLLCTALIIVTLSGKLDDGRHHEMVVRDLLPAGLEIEGPVRAGEDGATAYDWLAKQRFTRLTEARDDRYVASFVVSGNGGYYWGDDDREFRFNNYLGRYHTRHLDLMDVLASFQPRANAGLHAMARLCGFPGKLGFDGSEVYAAYAAGRIDAIRRYCETDVLNTYLLYLRFQQMRGTISDLKREPLKTP